MAVPYVALGFRFKSEKESLFFIGHRGKSTLLNIVVGLPDRQKVL